MIKQTSNRRKAIGILVGTGTVASIGRDRVLGARPALGALLNVLDFGAKGDGVVDDTAAFIDALAAARKSNRNQNGVSIPPGTFRVDGPVTIRPGQTLTGAGYATLIDARKAKGPVFVCSSGTEADTEGPPLEIRALRGLGGAGDAGFIEVSVAGFALSDMFLSSAGIGIRIDGASDGIVTNVQFDQGLSGLVVRNAQNLIMSSILMFNMRFGFTLIGNCADITLSASQFSYSQYTSILAADGARIRNLTVNGCAFTSNEQRETFIGHFHCRAEEVSAAFSACSFRNWRGFAVRQSVGADVQLDFDSCSFDGLPTNTAYNQSVDASVIECGAGGAYSLSTCKFRNLKGPLVSLGTGPGKITISGGSIVRPPPNIITSAVGSQTKLMVIGLDGLAVINGQLIELPIWPTWTGWRLNVTGRAPREGRLDCELIILPSFPGSVRVLTVWSSSATSAPIQAHIAHNAIRLDFGKYEMVLPEVSASVLP